MHPKLISMKYVAIVMLLICTGAKGQAFVIPQSELLKLTKPVKKQKIRPQQKPTVNLELLKKLSMLKNSRTMQFSYKYNGGKVYKLKDGMACIVPDSINTMPVVIVKNPGDKMPVKK
jgi:cell division protein YceG involved in septum cleavage